MDTTVWFTGSYANNGGAQPVYRYTEMKGLSDLGWNRYSRDVHALHWPIIGYNGNEIGPPKGEEEPDWLGMNRAAFEGMLSLGDNFVFVVSFGLRVNPFDASTDAIVSPKREWGWIHRADSGKQVVSFSHHTQTRHPYIGMLSWVEPDHSSEGGLSELTRSWSDPEKWTKFFVDRIRAAGRKKTSQGEKLMSVGKRIKDEGVEILTLALDL